MLTVVGTGPLVTVQDRGRAGHAHLGVPRAGALDPPAAALGNRLVGNGPEAAVLEVLLGDLRVINHGSGRWAAMTGARADLVVGMTVEPWAQPFWWPQGTELSLGVPRAGLRSYLAVAGGIDVAPVLGSRSTDTLAWVGPARVEPGMELAVGEVAGEPVAVDLSEPSRPAGLRFTEGPRADWVASLSPLTDTAWRVLPDSDRIGLRLEGPPLVRTRTDELASEGIVLGAVQVPPDGRPVVFLADHPVTGGYPVVAVVDVRDLWQCAQARPGELIRFVRPPAAPVARRG